MNPHNSHWRDEATSLFDWDTSKLAKPQLFEWFMNYSIGFVGAKIFADEGDDSGDHKEAKVKVQASAIGLEYKMRRFINLIKRYISSGHIVIFALIYVGLKILLCALILPNYLQSINCKRSTIRNNGSLIERIACQMESEAIGIPLENMNKLFYMTFCFLAATSMYLARLVQRNKPLSSMGLQFIVDPRRQLDALDSKARYVLSKVEHSMQNFSTEMFDMFRDKTIFNAKFKMQTPPDFESINFLTHLLEDNWRQLHRYQQKDLPALRPLTYHLRSYQSLRRLFCFMMPGIFFTTCLGGLLNSMGIAGAIAMKCFAIEARAGCRLRRADYQIGWEFILAKFGFEQTIGGLTIMLTDCIMIHLDLFDNAKREIRVCLSRLQRMLEHPDTNPMSPISLEDHSQYSKELAARRARNISNRIEANKLLFVSNIKMKLYGLEARSNSASMKLVLEALILSLVSIIFSGVVIEMYANGKDRISRLIMLVPCWCFANVAAISCAHCQARLAELHSLCWSMMARATHIYRYQLDGVRIWRPTAGLGFAGLIWCRFLSSIDYWSTTYVPRPIGIQINYHTILEANFFIISILTIVYSR